MKNLSHHDPESTSAPGVRARRRLLASSLCACAGAAVFVSLGATVPVQAPDKPAGAAEAAGSAATLRDARTVLGKWIETQQIVSKERNDWAQGREVLGSRIELMRREVLGLQEKVAATRQRIGETKAKKDDLVAQRAQLEAVGAQLTQVVAGMEGEVRTLFKRLPEPAQARLQPLRQRIPEPNAEGRVTVAERFQNVIGILNDLNKANGEITVNYEVRNLADGKPSEVRVLYIGLAQAFYVSAGGQSGIGRPANEGWAWEPNQSVSADVLTALEIYQGKHTPAFVPLPVKIQ